MCLDYLSWNDLEMSKTNYRKKFDGFFLLFSHKRCQLMIFQNPICLEIRFFDYWFMG